MKEKGFVFIKGGSYRMGSPKKENWRTADEKRHTVTVDDFYMSAYEVSQAEYRDVMGKNPSSFSGKILPVESVSWMDAVRYCNARSRKEGLTPVYNISGNIVSWKRGADGYRLPTEAEWEYACRAGTSTPFNTKTSISAKEANYYGHYPYEIEENYFNEEKLETKPGTYREKTVKVNSFSPNAWRLYNMHGNVSTKPAQIATTWAIAKGTLPIIGVTKASHVEDAAKAASIALSEEEMARMESAADELSLSTIRYWEKKME